jgi:hypothetical protein
VLGVFQGIDEEGKQIWGCLPLEGFGTLTFTLRESGFPEAPLILDEPAVLDLAEGPEPRAMLPAGIFLLAFLILRKRHEVQPATSGYDAHLFMRLCLARIAKAGLTGIHRCGFAIYLRPPGKANRKLASLSLFQVRSYHAKR